MNRIIYFLTHWKLGIHLLFGTKRFGVNNKWWNDFDSVFGTPWYDIHVFRNYKTMKFRAEHCHFITTKEKKYLNWKDKH